MMGKLFIVICDLVIVLPHYAAVPKYSEKLGMARVAKR